MTAAPERVDWWTLAACKDTAHLHLAPVPNAYVGVDSPQAQARHLCRTHCPVMARCAADIADKKTRGVVQAGEMYGEHGATARVQPPDPGCGPWCADLRRSR